MVESAIAQHRDLGVSPEESFRLRAWARAYLFAAGEIGLLDAVDALQAMAVDSGLVRDLGQDAIQTIMAREFARVRWGST